MGFSLEHKVYFATFVLKSEADHWWRATQDTLPYDADKPLMWEMFLRAFCEYFIIEGMRDEKMAKFLKITQGSKIVL